MKGDQLKCTRGCTEAGPQKGFVRRRTGRDQFNQWWSINHVFDILERITIIIYLPGTAHKWHEDVIRFIFIDISGGGG